MEPSIKIVHDRTGAEHFAAIPAFVSYADYCEIMDSATLYDAKTEKSEIKFFRSHITALKRLVKDTEGKVIPWEEIDAKEANEVYEAIETFFPG